MNIRSSVCSLSGILAASTSVNVTIDKRTFNALPEIQAGEPCVPGRMYRMECNTCRCGPEYSLLCTKMACLNWQKFLNINKRKKSLRQEDQNASKQKRKKTLRQASKKSGKYDSNKTLRQNDKKDIKPHFLPKIQKGMMCKPGKFYRSGCKRCFCTDESQILCSQKTEACKFDKEGLPLTPVSAPEDVRPPFTSSLVQELQTLSSASEKCVPGKSYMVDCNTCICTEGFNLLCGKLLCISYDDMHRLEAKEMSGKFCKEKETFTKNCKKCECVDGKTDCHEIPLCVDKLLLAGGEEPKAKIDGNHDQCQPNTIYKVDCNKCYCQEDGSLRCTQKTCLNYSQVTILEKQRQYLEKHGL